MFLLEIVDFSHIKKRDHFRPFLLAFVCFSDLQAEAEEMIPERKEDLPCAMDGFQPFRSR